MPRSRTESYADQRVRRQTSVGLVRASTSNEEDRRWSSVGVEDEGHAGPSYARATKSSAVLSARQGLASERRSSAAAGEHGRSFSLSRSSSSRGLSLARKISLQAESMGDSSPSKSPRFKTQRRNLAMLESNSRCLKGVELFQQASEGFLEMLAEQVTIQAFNVGSDIFRQGEFGENMYILNQGTVEVVVNDNVVATLSDGSVFGEMAAICKDPAAAKRSATIRAKTFCDCRVVARTGLARTLTHFPYEQRLMDISVQKRLTELQAKGHQDTPSTWRNRVGGASSSNLGESHGAQLWKHGIKKISGLVMIRKISCPSPCATSLDPESTELDEAMLRRRSADDGMGSARSGRLPNSLDRAASPAGSVASRCPSCASVGGTDSDPDETPVVRKVSNQLTPFWTKGSFEPLADSKETECGESGSPSSRKISNQLFPTFAKKSTDFAGLVGKLVSDSQSVKSPEAAATTLPAESSNAGSSPVSSPCASNSQFPTMPEVSVHGSSDSSPRSVVPPFPQMALERAVQEVNPLVAEGKTDDNRVASMVLPAIEPAKALGTPCGPVQIESSLAKLRQPPVHGVVPTKPLPRAAAVADAAATRVASGQMTAHELRSMVDPKRMMRATAASRHRKHLTKETRQVPGGRSVRAWLRSKEKEQVRREQISAELA